MKKAPVQRKDRTINGYLRPIYRWHRALGVVSVVFVIVLSITGILLNHNAKLGLNTSIISSEWLLNLYDIDPEAVSDFGYPTEVLTVDRIILDIHTGRAFGVFGPIVMDGVAIILLLLSFSGIYMWAKRKRQKKDNKKRNKQLKSNNKVEDDASYEA